MSYAIVIQRDIIDYWPITQVVGPFDTRDNADAWLTANHFELWHDDPGLAGVDPADEDSPDDRVHAYRRTGRRDDDIAKLIPLQLPVTLVTTPCSPR